MSVKIVVIGAGSSYTPEIIEGFILRNKELPITDLWLVDIEEGAERLEIITAMVKRMYKAAGINCTIHATLNREEALPNADYVVTQIRVGQLDARIIDERIPLEHGMIGQETNGAGGFMKAMRTIPVLLDIAHDMERLCPDAWLVNFTNPSGIVTEAVLKYSTIKCIGLCNMSQSMQRMVASLLDVDKDDLQLQLTGLNHFIFGVHAWVGGKDRVKEALTNMEQQSKQENPKNIPEVGWNYDQVKDLGAIPCGYLRYYFVTEEMLADQLRDFKATGTTRATTVKQVEKDLFEQYKDPNLSHKPKELELRGGAYYSEAACELINAIHNDKKILMTVITQNNGVIKCLPDNVAIETTAVITKEGALPLNVGELSSPIRGLLNIMKSFEEATIEAAVHGDYAKAVQAFTLNPLIPSGKTSLIVLDELIEAHKKYLPQFNK